MRAGEQENWIRYPCGVQNAIEQAVAENLTVTPLRGCRRGRYQAVREGAVAIVLPIQSCSYPMTGGFHPTIKSGQNRLCQVQTGRQGLYRHFPPGCAGRFTNQAREYIERDREPEKGRDTGAGKEISGKDIQNPEPGNKAVDSEKR